MSADVLPPSGRPPSAGSVKPNDFIPSRSGGSSLISSDCADTTVAEGISFPAFHNIFYISHILHATDNQISGLLCKACLIACQCREMNRAAHFTAAVAVAMAKAEKGNRITNLGGLCRSEISLRASWFVMDSYDFQLLTSHDTQSYPQLQWQCCCI